MNRAAFKWTQNSLLTRSSSFSFKLFDTIKGGYECNEIAPSTATGRKSIGAQIYTQSKWDDEFRTSAQLSTSLYDLRVKMSKAGSGNTRDSGPYQSVPLAIK